MTEGIHQKNRGLRIVVPVLLIGGGIAVFAALKATTPKAKKMPVDERGVLVAVVEARSATHEIEINGQGRVIPAQQVVLSPEVGGRIVWQSDALVPGGRLSAGDVVVRIDARDYKLAAQQQQAAVDRARLELDIERSRKKVAAREWELLGGETGGDTSANLALREPQLRTAKVAVEAAESGLGRARLAVAKTVVKAPFNATVQGEQVEVGQLVGPQAPLATLVGTDQFWVQVSVPIDDLATLAVPGVNVAAGAGSAAHVWQQVGAETVERDGTIVRLLGDLDPTGGMARLLIQIDDPLGLRKPEAERGLPLLLGAFVNVRIAAGEVEGAVALPRTALRGGDRVYVVDAENRLAVRDVIVQWRTSERVFVSKGLADGDKVIVSQISDTIPGTKLRIAEPEPTSAPAAAEAVPEKDAS